MIIEPKMRGFICLTSHPEGCAQNVKEQINYVKSQGIINGPKRVLIIGASTGFGLASRITAAFGMNASTIGIFFEKPAMKGRTASPGWYNSAAFQQEAEQAGLYAKSINGDAFSDEVKQQTIDLIKTDLGQVDLVIYSLAAPVRKDPKTGVLHRSTLKPIGQSYTNKTVDFHTGVVSEISLEPANEEDIANTVAVMGGEDWRMWMDAMMQAGVLSDNAMTVAFSYLGPELTKPIYRNGTIGRAKDDLEMAAKTLNKEYGDRLKAYISVNKALVTQASSAIPVVPLYVSLLYKLMKENGTHEGTIEQMQRLFNQRLYSGNKIPTDEKGRIRIDDLEMKPEVQNKITELWKIVDTENINELSDLAGYRTAFENLFGFSYPEVDYKADIDENVNIKNLQ